MKIVQYNWKIQTSYWISWWHYFLLLFLLIMCFALNCSSTAGANKATDAIQLSDDQQTNPPMLVFHLHFCMSHNSKKTHIYYLHIFLKCTLNLILLLNDFSNLNMTKVSISIKMYILSIPLSSIFCCATGITCHSQCEAMTSPLLWKRRPCYHNKFL